MTGELRCTPGQSSRPTDDECNRHDRHYWCGYCAGWYGVPHDFGCHSRELVEGKRVVHALGSCACRFCRIAWTSGTRMAVEVLRAAAHELPVPEPADAAVVEVDA